MERKRFHKITPASQMSYNCDENVTTDADAEEEVLLATIN